MKIRLIAALALIIGLAACNKKEDPQEVTKMLKSDAIILTESHWAPLQNGDTIRLSFEENTREGGIMRDDTTSIFAKVFIDSAMVAEAHEIPWQGFYVVDLEPGSHELFATGRVNLKEFSLHGISLYVTK